MSKRDEFSKRAAQLSDAAYRSGFQAGIDHIPGIFDSKRITARSLLERFVDLYSEAPIPSSMIEIGRKLWRDYYEFSGLHMILTDEGWEPGEIKQSYLDDDPDSILDEVNAPEAPHV